MNLKRKKKQFFFFWKKRNSWVGNVLRFQWIQNSLIPFDNRFGRNKKIGKFRWKHLHVVFLANIQFIHCTRIDVGRTKSSTLSISSLQIRCRQNHTMNGHCHYHFIRFGCLPAWYDFALCVCVCLYVCMCESKTVQFTAKNRT